ncbi:MAG: cysteine synthase family protein [Actinomycetota bacterium]|nr:cysteine synthase family protein [Actinomycetota bacterium]
MIYKNILELIGNTPLIEIKRMHDNPDVKIYAKLESQNPSGSLKDRIALYMIEAAERAGELRPGSIILEATSGNTGISLAMIAKYKGYKLKAVMPDNVSLERRQLLEVFGAELVLSDGEQGTNGAIKLAREIGAGGGYCLVDQYSNEANPLAHYETTAVEILREVPRVDVFVAGLGTGGTLMGVGRRLKEVNAKTRVVAVQPYPHGGLQGLRNLSDGFVPAILDMDLLDANELVEDEEAFFYLKRLAEEEAVLAGISSGAVIYKSLEIAKTMKAGTIVTVFPDGAWKYLSEKIWTESPEEVSKRFKGPLW